MLVALNRVLKNPPVAGFLLPEIEQKWLWIIVMLF